MWTKDEQDNVRGLLARFCDADEVCAVVGCDKADLDELCTDAFGMDFERSSDKFSAQGRALLRKAQFDLAMAGDRNMLLQLGREQLGQESGAYKPKKTRAEKTEQEAKETKRAENKKMLTLLQSKYKNQQAVGL